MAAKHNQAQKRRSAGPCAAPRRPSRRYGQSDAPAGLASVARWLTDLFFRVALGLQRYRDDLLAIALLVFALISALGIAGVTSGRLVDPWAGVLGVWLGWGAALVPLAVGAVGLALLARNFGRPVRVSWPRVLAGEVAIFAALGGLSVLFASSVDAARAGRGGGVIGWGIATLLADMAGVRGRNLILAGLLILGGSIALDLRRGPLRQALEWLRWRASDWATEASRGTPSGEKSAPPRETPVVPARPRGRFKAEPQRAEAPARPRKRNPLLPPLDLLSTGDVISVSSEEINHNAGLIEKTLAEFGLPARVIDYRSGPAVTQYAVEPGYSEKIGPDGNLRHQKVRVSQISALANDLALALSASTLRIEAPVPGRSYVGVEVPNRHPSLVALRPVIESEAFQKIASPLAVALGRDVSGRAVAADLATMPHLLIAGTTGSGKSVCITALVTCLVTNNTPDDLRLVMIDPKMVELVRFNGLPHLYGKVETELDRIIGVLRWCTLEMDRRYKLFEEVSARNLEAYNKKIGRRKDAERLPRLVVMLDELADLMMQAPDQTERTLVRLAQMARATGIHLVVATQRPSTDVVTGLIKANFPARASFAVASSVDSRVILDANGAESLLGRGDMLFLPPEAAAPLRLQGCLVTDREVDSIVNYWREQVAQEIVEQAAPLPGLGPAPAPPPPPAAPWDQMLAREMVVEDKDDLIERAIAVIQRNQGRASASLLQRRLNLGYPRAARLMDELYEMGIIGRPQAGGKTREVLIEADDDPIGERAAKIIGGDDL